jgi:hypothetical protein
VKIQNRITRLSLCDRFPGRSAFAAGALALLVCAPLFAGSANAPESAPAQPDRVLPPALARAWAFASAIENDDKDRGKYREKVVQAIVETGDLPAAAAFAEKIENWRRGVAFADIALEMMKVQDVQTNAVRDLLVRANLEMIRAEDWRRDRIRMHMAQVWAMSGEQTKIEALQTLYVEADEVARIEMSRAIGEARAGDLAAALRRLDAMAEKPTYYDVLWRVEAYRFLADVTENKDDDLTGLFERAWDAAEAIPGYRREEIRLDMLAQMVSRSVAADAVAAWLEEVAGRVKTPGLPGHIQGMLLGQTARVYGVRKDPDAVQALLDLAEPLMDEGMMAFERPEIRSMFAEAFALAGDAARAKTQFAAALDTTVHLVNPRPRAIAATEICLAMQRGGADPADFAEALDALERSFGEAGSIAEGF